MNCGIASPMTCSKTQLERAVVKLSHLSQVQRPDLRYAPMLTDHDIAFGHYL